MRRNCTQIEASLFDRVMSAEAGIHQEAMNQSKSAFAGEIVMSSRKRTHQQLVNGFKSRKQRLADSNKKLEDSKQHPSKKPKHRHSCLDDFPTPFPKPPPPPPNPPYNAPVAPSMEVDVR